MSIAIPTYAPGAITSYSDLVSEIRDMMDDADYSQVSIDRALRKAEAQFNRTLRTPEMEKRIPLQVTGELTMLPVDFLQMRSIYVEAMPDRTLQAMAPNGITGTYGGYEGCPQGYSIEGRFLRVAPVGAVTLDVGYYAALAPLSDAQVTNWLLDKHPDLYVAGALYHLARRERDQEGMAQAAQEVATLTANVQQSAHRNRWGSSPLIPSGIMQARGARI